MAGDIFIIVGSNWKTDRIRSELTGNGHKCVVGLDEGNIAAQVMTRSPDIVLVAHDDHLRIKELTEKVKMGKELPVLALVRQASLGNTNGHLDIVDDFVTEPCNHEELLLRVKRLLNRKKPISGEITSSGDLQINLTECKATLCGNIINLTYIEYELLKFLASNKGRVFTRDSLLNKVWGYDYYGGDRTVDVHIRRLRSKIEDPTHTFIETVRNIGYRFKDDLSH